MRLGAYHYISKDVDLDGLPHAGRQRQRTPGSEPRRRRACARRSPSSNEREFVVGPSQSHARDHRPGAEGGQAVGHRADPRRERHRQGTAGAADPPRSRQARMRRSSPSTSPRFPRSSSRARCSVTRRARSPARIRQQLGKFELANGGTLFLDEIGDLQLRPAGQAAARDPGRRDRARRRHASDQDRLPADRRHQRRPREGREGRPVPRGSLLPAQRHPDPDAARCASASRICPSSRASSCAATT